MNTTAISRWSEALDRALEGARWFHRVHVLRETDSTQDAARRMHAGAGEVVVAARQVAGRGRLGRAWADTGEAGVACTFVVAEGRVERLAAVAAVGTAMGIEQVLERSVSLKWPNDVYVDGRKLAGVLIERSSGPAAIGVGVNVGQPHFEGELASRAISMRMLGVEADRVEVIAALLRALDRAMSLEDEALSDAFDRRCILKGRRARFSCGGAEHEGVVRRVDPLRGLELGVGEREVSLPAATTAVLTVEGVHEACLKSGAIP
jgi:BirA family transcriptional regulator, biotin operon repressor / biotin---[acetyl-CoA-carboxylase] ligase